MDKSIFIDKTKVPNDNDLFEGLGETHQLWQSIKDYVHLKYPKAIDLWNYSRDKYGWSFRIKDKKRAIVYMLPRDKYFKVAFVFGQKATDTIMKSQVSDSIKTELGSARVYAEGRGIRIDVKDEIILNDIKELIDIKIAN
jgi:tRNA U38,U39,U40 pseudouridine synthase TruA